ncbi:SDR family oxidoreductase [Steroidobacter sp.]|uniref:SDR family oxidoreductase n=1 Tax=Steroidobacter sp. TaxID=1978227 RepID=UPI001A5A708D|nr:SDR family oxidoreductase [Steroidobacter sp.]MBL8270254.1 SDR family oxidoreductase [Steroidobacter sp.]
MKAAIQRRLAVITGGCGGMGIACAREFGRAHDLVLTDISAERLSQTQAQLHDEGYLVRACVAGDLAEPTVISALMETIDSHGPLGVLLHTAGVSSGMAEWQRILRTNVVGTRLLLAAIESRLSMGSVGILIASVAGHVALVDKQVDALLASDTPADELLARMEPHLQRLVATQGQNGSFVYSSLSGPSYGLSKRATIREAALRAAAWAKRGARIVSISPGIIWTPMGRYEVEHGQAASIVLEQTSLRRWGTSMDIARAAAFLASEDASFITGTDLRIDGGMIPARLGEGY